MTITNYAQIRQYKSPICERTELTLQSSACAYPCALVPSRKRANISSRHRHFDEIPKLNSGFTALGFTAYYHSYGLWCSLRTIFAHNLMHAVLLHPQFHTHNRLPSGVLRCFVCSSAVSDFIGFRSAQTVSFMSSFIFIPRKKNKNRKRLKNV